MQLLNTGVFGTSGKKQEKRVPIHPDHLNQINDEIKKHLFFEKGYGIPFGKSDEELENECGGILSREELFQQCEIAILAKPVVEDFNHMQEGSILWGWPHCVQQSQITQIAIDRKLTLIAWEAMHNWSSEGEWQGHSFHSNNEIAGYAGVHHAMNLAGIDGNYGPDRKAAIISYGSVSRGAIKALRARGIKDITVFTHVDFKISAEQIFGVKYYEFDEGQDGNLQSIRPDSDPLLLYEELLSADIIVNGILQDTDHPLLFVPEDQNKNLKPGCLIIDVSCDEGMAFTFATPTDFATPILQFDQVSYYAVDHTPSYLWNAASWEISKSVIQYLPTVMGGAQKWKENETIRKAIEIQNGIIINSKILSFQNRAKEYPHARL